MLNLIQRKVRPTDIIVKLFISVLNFVDDGIQEWLFVGLFLIDSLVGVDLFQEVVDVHALVDIQEKGNYLRSGQAKDVYLVKFGACSYVLFVF